MRLHLASFLVERKRLGAPLPRFVVDELMDYLDCGRISAGCARFECEGRREHLARDGNGPDAEDEDTREDPT